jgi:porin
MRNCLSRTASAVIASACGVLHAEESRTGGYGFDAVYTADVLVNVAGGVDRGARYLDNLDVMLEVDVAAAWGFGAGNMFVYGLYNNGTTFADELVGDLLVTSNIDAPEALRLYELWYEFGEGPWSVRSGLYDLNSEFDVNETGGVFINSAHGIGAALGQTGENGPSIFPVSSLAVRMAYETEGYIVRVAVLDGVPGDPDDPSSNKVDLSRDDGALIVGELELPVGGDGRLWTGYWRYTADFTSPFENRVFDDNDGWYLGGEHGFSIAEYDVAWFLRYGRADARLNPLDEYIGAGLVVQGPLAGRPDDRAGLAVGSGRTGKPFRNDLWQSGSEPEAHETAWEITYRARVNEQLVLQPDIQFVQNPGGSRALDDALVIGLRIEVSW